MSQVRNLRAMFEQKGESTSPPDRGRSPGIASTGTESPRPLSKVRTSFIAIEKDGRIGLRRDHSGESSLSRRRMSIETEGDSATQDTTTTTFDESGRSFRSIRNMEPPIPESPRQDEAGKKENKTDAATTKVNEKEKAPARAPAASTAAKADGKAINGGTSKSSHDTTTHAPAPKATAARPAKLPTTSAAATATATASKEAAKALKSPTTTKPLASPHARDAKPTKASPAPAKKTTPAPAKQATSGIRKPAPAQLPSSTMSGIGFVKPKPKSPTKPANLPSSLMAPTRSSVSKVNQAKAAGTSSMLHAPQTLGRSPSRASVSTTTSTLRRQSSVAGRPRPSFGPPPKKYVEEKPAVRKDRDVDESFLARMMRPTQSSQSKTTDKAPVTPPRKANARRPLTSHGDGSVKRESSARKVASTRKAASSIRSESPTPARSGSAIVTKETEVAREVAQAETAEEAISIAHKADAAENSQQLQEEPQATSPTPAEEASLEVPAPPKAESVEAAEAQREATHEPDAENQEPEIVEALAHLSTETKEPAEEAEMDTSVSVEAADGGDEVSGEEEGVQHEEETKLEPEPADEEKVEMTESDSKE